MTKPKLTYFDIATSRGEECRLALVLAGVDFEDVRLSNEEFDARRPNTPYGALPMLELPGTPPLAQSNVILRLIGRRYALHPTDEIEAARHEGMMDFVEDLRHRISPTYSMKDPAQRKAAREELATAIIPDWAAFAETHIEGPFFAGRKLHVVDLKLFMVVRWLASGVLDHVPATVLAPFSKLMGVHKAVGEHAVVKAWFTRT